MAGYIVATLLCKMKRIFKNHWKILVGLLWLAFVVVILSCIKDEPELLRGIGLFLLGTGIAPLGLLLAYNRTESLKFQAETEKEKAVTEKEKAVTEKEKAVTEAFAKSVELLGNKREAARQGGIYALGRLAGDNPDLHPMIMDIVASYIRQESRHRFFSEKKEREERENKSIDKDGLIDELRSEPMAMDIEAAIAVIRERNTNNDKILRKGEDFLDLSNAYIFNADFSNTKLSKVNFSDSVMVDCFFDETDLSNSNFIESNVGGSSFVASNLKGSSITQNQVDSMGDTNEKTVLPEGLSPRNNDNNSTQG